MREIRVKKTGEFATVVGDYDGENGTKAIRAFQAARLFAVVLLVAFALASFFPLRSYFSTPETYAPYIQTLDEKKANVLGLVAASTAASASISLIPDDAGTPIAEKLMDLSTNFMIVLAIIYLEKYLLTIFGLVAFGGLIPAALVCLALSLCLLGRSSMASVLGRLSAKLAVFAAVLMLAVPSSVCVTDMIDQTYEMSTTMSESTGSDAAAQDAPKESGSIVDFITSIPGKVAESVTSITDELLDQVNQLIEGAAVMIVTSCLIPILVLAFYLWVAHTLLGIDASAPKQFFTSRVQRMHVNRRDCLRTGKGGSMQAKDA